MTAGRGQGEIGTGWRRVRRGYIRRVRKGIYGTTRRKWKQ